MANACPSIQMMRSIWFAMFHKNKVKFSTVAHAHRTEETLDYIHSYFCGSSRTFNFLAEDIAWFRDFPIHVQVLKNKNLLCGTYKGFCISKLSHKVG
jgi:hypothetical protein